MSRDPLEVRLSGVSIGEIRGDGSFAWVSDWSRIAPLNSPVLSLSLPFGAEDLDPGPFFGGLLPEGIGLSRLAREAHVRSDDLHGLLAEVGADVGGSVTIGEPRPPLDPIEIEEEEYERILARAAGYIRGATVGGGGSAATGVQSKIALTRDRGTGRWLIGRGSTPSTHLLKPVSVEFEERIRAEATMNAVAVALGLSVHEAWVEPAGRHSVLVVERYDRRLGPGGLLERVHQEDAAQALGLPWGGDEKYENVNPRACLAEIARLLPGPSPLRREPAAPGDARAPRERLLALTVLNVACGNTDAHAKNFSLMLPELGAAFEPHGRTATLADAYDIVPQVLFDHEASLLSLRIGGKKFWREITAEHLIEEGTRWGLPRTRAAGVVEETLRRIQGAAAELAENSGAVSGEATAGTLAGVDRLIRLLAEVTSNLLRGDAAWAGHSTPPAIAISGAMGS